MPPQKRKRHAFFLRPKAAAELAGMLVGFEGVFERLSIDLNDEGLTIFALDPGQICMAFLRAPASAFSTFEVENPVHFVLDASIVKRVFRGKTNDFVFYQESSDLDSVVFEKIATGVKMTIGILDGDGERLVIPRCAVEARYAHETGRELTKSLSDLIATLKAEDVDTVEFEALSTGKGPKWFVRHGERSVRFSQILKTGVNEVTTPQSMKFPASYVCNFLHLVANAKGPTEIRFVKNDLGTLFSIHAEATDSDFELDLYLAPKIEE